MIPHFPPVISPNGDELWDWAGKLSQHVQLLDRARRLRQQLSMIDRECGSCQLWMTSRCPREHSTMTGYNKGPSMSAPICNLFVMSLMSLKSQQGWRDELATIEAGQAQAKEGR
jgi:hypothetical protein